MNIDTRVNLGDSVTDVISGHRGIATAIQVMLNGCISILVEAKTTKAKPDSADYWLDEQRLKIMKRIKFKPQKSVATVGGPKRRVYK